MDFDLSLPAPAKLNLFLHIVGQRPNGYHELQTVFQLLDAGDNMHFKYSSASTISLHPDFADIPLKDNLVYKAAKLLQQHSQCSLGAEIVLEKNLPMGGGLGGGSSNAATTLLALNKLWDLKLSLNELAEIGITLGADVPVFVKGFTAWAEGIGEQLTPIKIPEYWYLILTPKSHVSTAQIFSNERLTRDTPKLKIAPALEGRDLDHFHNDCETIVTTLYPDIKDAISWLNQFGLGRLTGTGACCFSRFESEAKARQVLNEAQSTFKGFVAKGVHLSPAHQRLNEAD